MVTFSPSGSGTSGSQLRLCPPPQTCLARPPGEMEGGVQHPGYQTSAQMGGNHLTDAIKLFVCIFQPTPGANQTQTQK